MLNITVMNISKWRHHHRNEKIWSWDSYQKQRRGCGVIQESIWTGIRFYEKFPDGAYQHAVLLKDGKEVFRVASLLSDFDAEKQIISLESILRMKPRCGKHLPY